jgi:hypothetical protein
VEWDRLDVEVKTTLTARASKGKTSSRRGAAKALSHSPHALAWGSGALSSFKNHFQWFTRIQLQHLAEMTNHSKWFAPVAVAETPS